MKAEGYKLLLQIAFHRCRFLTASYWNFISLVTEFCYFFILCSYKPDVIKGDMDSVRPEVKEHYSNLVSCFKFFHIPYPKLYTWMEQIIKFGPDFFLVHSEMPADKILSVICQDIAVFYCAIPSL